MKKIVGFALLFAFVVSLNTETFAQKFTKRKRYMSVGFHVGAANYVGDLDPGQSAFSPSLKKSGISLGLFAGLIRLTPRLSVRGGLTYNLIRGNDWDVSTGGGDDRFRRVRNLSFINNVIEIKVDAVYDIFANKGTYLKRPDYVPFVFLGIAAFYHDPMAKDPETAKLTRLRPLMTEGKSYSPVSVSIPFGVGIRKKMNKMWDVSFEIGWRWTFTDYLDDVSGNYIGSTDPKVRKFETRSNTAEVFEYAISSGLGDNYIVDQNVPGGKFLNGFGEAGDKRGTQSENDWYIISAIQFTKILKGGVRCPKFR